MSDNTKIEWTEATLNVVNGCSVISPGCKNCYAMRSGVRNLPEHPSTGLTQPSKAGHVWTGEVRFNEQMLLQPLRWKRGRRIFWNAHGDLFHENVPDEWIDRCFAVMALTPQHRHQVLTKRSARMRAYITDRARMDWLNVELEAVAEQARIANPNCVCRCDRDDGDIKWPLQNVWLGVSVEDQQRADERIPDLLATPAAGRFLSCEPLLGPVDLSTIVLRRDGGRPTDLSARLGDYVQPLRGNFTDSPRIGWVIVGGESGKGARPMHPDWVRSIRDQCAAAGVPFHFKQWGDWLPWEPGCPPEWEAQNGHRDDHHALFPDDIDSDPRWDDGIWAVPEHSHFAFQRVGKRAAGRLLDGVQHDGMPS